MKKIDNNETDKFSFSSKKSDTTDFWKSVYPNKKKPMIFRGYFLPPEVLFKFHEILEGIFEIPDCPMGTSEFSKFTMAFIKFNIQVSQVISGGKSLEKSSTNCILFPKKN